jgi:hypothetical protein
VGVTDEGRRGVWVGVAIGARGVAVGLGSAAGGCEGTGVAGGNVGIAVGVKAAGSWVAGKAVGRGAEAGVGTAVLAGLSCCARTTGGGNSAATIRVAIRARRTTMLPDAIMFPPPLTIN